MITLAERRAAGRFADLVDSPDIDGIPADTAGELAPLLLLRRTIGRVPVNGDIDPEFRAKLRTRVVAMSAVRLPAQRAASEPATPAAAAKSPRSRSGRRLIVAGGAMACVLSVAGIGVASSHAVMGDPLYGIKRATESTQLKLAGSDASKGRRYLTVARTRLGEARQVRGNEAAVVETLGAMDLATRNGTRLLTGVAASDQDRAPLDSIDEFAAAQRTGLGSLISGLPAGPARERAVESLVLIERLQARSVALRATLVCPAAAASADDLGPRPTSCTGAGPGSGTAPNAAPLGPGLNSGPAPSGLGGTALPGGTPGGAGAGTGVTAPPVPPPGSGAAGAVSGIVDDLLGGLGGNSGASAGTGTPPPLLPLPLPSIIPTLPPLLP